MKTPTKKRMKTLDLSKVRNITQPDEHGIQVRIQHHGKEFSKYFSFSFWEEKPTRKHTAKAQKLALKSAIKWRDDMRMVFAQDKKITFRKRPLSNNRSTGIVGVSRYKKQDRAKDGHYVIYSVSWCELINGRRKRRVTAFNAGLASELTPEKEEQIKARAVAFRKRWEESLENEVPFDPKAVIEELTLSESQSEPKLESKS